MLFNLKVMVVVVVDDAGCYERGPILVGEVKCNLVIVRVAIKEAHTGCSQLWSSQLDAYVEEGRVFRVVPVEISVISANSSFTDFLL
jgi:hypothetical protein